MKSSWYKKSMPMIKDIQKYLPKIIYDIKKIPSVKDVYIFGSYAENKDNPYFRVNDIDIITKTNLHSEDLVAIDQNSLHAAQEYLEEEGFEPDAVEFTKTFSKQINILDKWAISSDNKLLHYGPIVADKHEAEQIKQDAEKYAEKNTGQSRYTISQNKCQHWYRNYKNHIEKHLSDMPYGWYISDEKNIKSVLEKSIKV